MAVQLQERMTAAEFDRYVRELDGDYEYIAGEVVAVVSNNYSSQVALLIGALITVFVHKNNLGWVTGADGGYVVNSERYIPDIGFIRREKQPEVSHDAYNVNAPELAVEVVSPTDKPQNLLVKVSNYLAAGTIVWVVYPDEKAVHVHQAGQGAKIMDGDAILTCELLPGFELAVKDIFPKA
jgi:Uma2 family endonuclease